MAFQSMTSGAFVRSENAKFSLLTGFLHQLVNSKDYVCCWSLHERPTQGRLYQLPVKDTWKTVLQNFSS